MDFMAMGQKRECQDSLFTPTSSLARSPGHPFYESLNRILSKHGFDVFVEEKCQSFYAEHRGRPSIPPGVYFRMFFLGYFEGLDSERGIAWRVKDSLSLRAFIGYNLSQDTPDHSSLSRIRQRLPVELHQDVFNWVVTVLAKEKLLKGKTVGVDATTLEANAAMRSIVRRDTGETYRDYVTGLAEASGIEDPTDEDVRKFDKKRKKKTSNTDWHNPHDPDARVTKMKDGRTHMAHKVEHVTDVDTSAIVAVTLRPGDEGDSQSLPGSLAQAAQTLEAVAADPDARDAVYANRRRIKGNRSALLRCLRAERVERGFAHNYDTGGMRRIHLRGHENIFKRLVTHVAGHNLGLLMRQICGAGTPRGLQDLNVLFESMIQRIQHSRIASFLCKTRLSLVA
jgi:transposase